MRVLGIDPGLATIGLGLIDAPSPHELHVKEWLVITTKPGLTLAERLKEIFEDLTRYLQETRPDLAVVEKLFFATNEKTAMDVSHARGCILLALAQAHVPLIEATPLQLKSAIAGDGKADKRQVQDMVVRMLSLTEIPKPDDAADALALAAYGAVQSRPSLMGIA